MQQYHDKYEKLPFSWMKFHEKKNAKFFPAFVYPPDPDGKCRAQWVTATGNISKTKNEFHEFHQSLPDKFKEKTEICALKQFNEKFKFSFS